MQKVNPTDFPKGSNGRPSIIEVDGVKLVPVTHPHPNLSRPDGVHQKLTWNQYAIQTLMLNQLIELNATMLELKNKLADTPARKPRGRPAKETNN